MPNVTEVTESSSAPRSGPPSTGQPPIADYGFVSDCHSAALIDRGGSVDWWCVPRFDSPSVFGRLLDQDAGHWLVRPCDEFEVEREYAGDTLVLRTVFRTVQGEVAISDALALDPDARSHDLGLRVPHMLIRRVEGVRGSVEMETEFAPRMEYGRSEPHFRADATGVVARGGPTRLTLRSPVTLRCGDGAARGCFVVSAGETVEFRLGYEPSFGEGRTGQGIEPTLEDTKAAWQSWADLHDGYDGLYREEVRRSSLVLQGLTYQPSGAVIAAATTSLPELMGGDLNFDYRYAWLRDLSLTIRSLWIAACPDEPARLFDWFTNAAGRVGPELIQIMYGVGGERDLAEHTLEHLSGYHGSRPVRVGNDAWTQVQLDVLGEVLDAAHVLRDQLGDLDETVQELLVILADRAAKQWTEPDAGMWEARDQQRQYVSSKVMCWVALDRAIKLADRLGPGADPARWAIARDEIHAAVVSQAWSSRSSAYAGSFASDDLDASVLLLPVVGFLPATDERMRSTIEAIASELSDGGLVRRWPDDPSGFLICTFWLVECLALAGEVDRAEERFQAAMGYANDLGLMSEEGDVSSGAFLGNFPQAFSHVGLINAAWRLTEAARPQTHAPLSTKETS